VSTLGENSKKALDDFAADTVKFAKINIGAKRRYKTSSGKFKVTRIDTTGTLRNSLDYEFKEMKNSFSISVISKGEAAKYADHVEEGRKKGSYAPISDLVQWIKDKRIKMRSGNKFVKTTKSRVNNMARNISKNIKKNGIPAKHYIKDASEQSFKKHEEAIGEGVFKDMEQAMTTIVSQLQIIGKIST
jgi:hypothetical protein